MTTMRFQAVDTFRGLAALMVILFHMQHLQLLSGIVFIKKSDIFVDFFFVLSGFVITHSNYNKITNVASIKPFIRRRFNRLYPLHLFTLILALLFEIFRYGVNCFVVPLSNPVFAADKTLPSFLSNLTLTQSLNLFDRVTWNGPSWSISVEFYTYIVWALGLVLFWKNLWIMCGFCFGLIIWFIIRHQGSIIYTYDYGFVRCLYSFLIGMMAYRISNRTVSQLNQGVSSAVELVLLSLTIYAVHSFTHSTSWSMPMLFALVIAVFSRESGAVSRWLGGKRFTFLGKLSYSYYLNHTVVLAVMDLALFKIVELPHSSLGDLTYVIVCLVCIHLLSVSTYRYIEHILQSPSKRPTQTAVSEMAAI